MRTMRTDSTSMRETVPMMTGIEKLESAVTPTRNSAAAIAGRIPGAETLRNVRHAPAPATRDASSSDESKLRNAAATRR
jgi:hypothetical protein